MSLFLGKIHHILYNKIQWFEGIEEKIIEKAKEQNISVEDLIQHINKHFGIPMGNKPLEEVIDTTNIHGWLQQRIENAEQRHAALITELLTWNPKYKSELIEIFKDQGQVAAKEYAQGADTADTIYQALNEYILEGMPCDRVNEIVDSSEEQFTWVTTTCLHNQHWEKVNGDVNNFYTFREAWIEAFVNELNPKYKYVKTEDGMNRIIKRV
ncbi:MAG: hypothetical protein CVU84_11110 [Firmicutes bacterium HGW-Firmicutes-1]|jgi:Ser-tRNA(Ala) deacylase AlaX|nr:MAG: hypothetical protein CVU84_11110 [Firmicutes bacterium HGW-Firmicutes-1]